MLELRADGNNEVITLGKDIMNNQRVQVIVPAGTWQGMFLNTGGKFALLGTTMAPGFEFEDFELAQKEKLIEQYPNQRQFIHKLSTS
jgi:predicted cupin superfamily sugar epimerase